MSTTSLIIEILVIGVFSAAWILLTLLRLSIPVESVLSASARIGPLYVVVATAALYQLGWLMNGLAHALVSLLFDKPIRDTLFRRETLTYEPVRATVYQKASPELRGDLATDRTVIRLARAGAINFLLIGILLATFGRPWLALSGLALLCALGSGLQWFCRYRRYYRRMISAYKVIVDPDLRRPQPHGTKDALI